MPELRVVVRKGERIENTLRRLRKKVERAGVIREFRKHQYFESPSERQRRAERKAKARQRRESTGSGS